MSVTPNRHLPLMEPSQSQPEVVYNEAMEILDVGGDGSALEVETSGASPGVRDVSKIKFVGAAVTEESGGVAIVTIDATSGGGGGSPLTVDALTNVTKITFTGPAVSVAAGVTGEAVVTIDTVSGGGGGASNVTPDTHPTSPATVDDEFEGTSLDGKWSWLNQSTVTAAFHDGSILLSGTTDGLIHAILQTAPATPYTVTAKVCLGASGPGAGVGVGLIAYNSANSHLYCYLFNTTSGPLVCISFNSPTSFNGVLFSNSNLPVGTANLAHWIYLQISNDGTTLNFLASQTGIPGTFQSIGSVALATFIGTVTDIGIAINNNVAGAVCVADYLRGTT